MASRLTAAQYRGMPKKRANKYHAKRTTVDGIAFHSKAESEEYARLKQLERGGLIRYLKLQPRYPLVVNDVLICDYIADFEYFEVLGGVHRVIDVKGVITPEYRIKKKLFEVLYHQRISEVYARRGAAGRKRRKATDAKGAA